MKRPEGFDASAHAPASTPSKDSAPRRTKKAPVVREKPVRAVREPRTPSTPPVRERATGGRAAEKAAAAELRRAERARKRVERRELKRFTRRQRTRRLAWLTGLGVLAALTALILVAVFSPLLALREIRVEGTSRLDPALIVGAVDGQLGTPLALLDEQRIRDELGEFSLIRSYTTELAPPGTLIVRIAERTPVGSIVRGTNFDLVDAAGVVIESTPARVPGMPVIQVAGDDVASAAFASVTEVLLTLPPEILAQVDSVTASTRDNVTLVLTASNQRVEWGSAARSDHKARVLAALVAIHAGSGPGLYDVSAPGSAVFRSE